MGKLGHQMGPPIRTGILRALHNRAHSQDYYWGCKLFYLELLFGGRVEIWPCTVSRLDYTYGQVGGAYASHAQSPPTFYVLNT